MCCHGFNLEAVGNAILQVRVEAPVLGASKKKSQPNRSTSPAYATTAHAIKLFKNLVLYYRVHGVHAAPYGYGLSTGANASHVPLAWPFLIRKTKNGYAQIPLY
jgi:hypothetical protein